MVFNKRGQFLNGNFSRISRLRTRKKAQNEMVGFVLIVVVVVIGLMIFLIMSARNAPEETESLEVANMLSVMLTYTTECAIINEPRFDTLGDLLKSCYEEKTCSNLERDACEYLNETLKDIMEDISASEAQIIAYQIDLLERDDEGFAGVYRLMDGNCTNGRVSGAQQLLHSGSDTLNVRMKICKELLV